MEKGIASPKGNSVAHSIRVFRPMLWWLLFVLVLYGIRTHQRWMEKTRLNFKASLNGQDFGFETTLDGNPISSGERISLGRHVFTIIHPKAEVFSTNIFAWYGGDNLGEVLLERTKGVVVITANPSPQLVTIRGPEFSLRLTNVVGWTSSVPTDIYQVHAEWINHEESRQVSVTSKNTSTVNYAPELGTLRFDTDPPGANVIGSSGKSWGRTPLLLSEIHAGLWKGEMRLEGFVPATFSLAVAANQTNSVQTNLINWQYSQAMAVARRSATSGEYDRGIEAITEALSIKRDAPEAAALRDKLMVAQHIREGKGLNNAHDLLSARKEIDAALRIDSQNIEAKALLESIVKQQEEIASEQRQIQERQLAEQTRQERLDSLETTMALVTGQHLDAALFNEQKMTFTNSVKALGKAIHDVLLEKVPTFEVNKYTWLSETLFTIDASQKVNGGLRTCILGGTQVGSNQSVIVFRIAEYETHLNVNLGGVLRVSDGQPPLVAVPNRKDRVSEGIKSMTERIRSTLQ